MFDSLKAFKDINNKKDGIFDDILPNTTLRIIHRSANNQFLKGALAVNEILQIDSKNGIMACIGPYSNRTLQGSAPAFQEVAGIPVFNYQDRSAWFGDSTSYPNIFRLAPAIYQDGRVIASLIYQYFGWKKVTVFSQNTDSSRDSVQTFNHYALQFGIEILSSHSIDVTNNDLTDYIFNAKQAGSRIFILFVDPSVGVKLIQQGYELKLFNDHTQIIGGEELTNSTTIWSSLNLSPQTLNTLLTGYIGVTYHSKAPSSPMKTKFLEDWVKQKSTLGYTNNQGVSVCDKSGFLQ